MSTNYLPWNPSRLNQESDADYLGDSMRVNGASTPSIFDAKLANKLFFQIAQMAFSMAQALVAKGYTVNDFPQANLQAVFAEFLTFKDIQPINLGFSATPVLDCSSKLCPTFSMMLTGNITSLDVSGQQIGQRVTFMFYQDGGGGHTISGVSANINGMGNISTDANAVSIQTFVVRADLQLYPDSPVIVS